MLEFEELKLKLLGYHDELCDLKDAIDYDGVKRHIAELEQQAAADGFWDDIENSQKILQKTSTRLSLRKPCACFCCCCAPALSLAGRWYSGAACASCFALAFSQ